MNSTSAITNAVDATSRTAARSKGLLQSECHRLTLRTRPRFGPIYSGELEPTSFDDLDLGGEWTTRRRTISESEIALFAAIAGDFSPLTVDTSGGGARLAPPAMLVAVAIGLGSMDMPLPKVAEWEWVNWKFPKPVRAGDTIYARWTLTQKRPPVGGTPTAIAVWRVDVHTADGALCAEGEVGASVVRKAAAADRGVEPAAGPPSSRRRRRRRTTPAAEGAPTAAAAPAPAERTSGPRRRRRRRSAGSPAAQNGNGNPPGPAAEPPAPISVPAPAVPAATAAASPLSRVMRRLRRT